MLDRYDAPVGQRSGVHHNPVSSGKHWLPWATHKISSSMAGTVGLGWRLERTAYRWDRDQWPIKP